MGRAWVVAIVAALAGAPLGAQAGLPRNFDAEVARALRTFGTPGVAIAVVKDGRVLLARGYGVRRLGDTAKVDDHTLFQIASNSKAYTTALLSMLADSGRVSWDDPVTRHLPWFQLYDPWVTREFTLRDLVTHRSGLGLGAGDLLWFHSNYGSREVVERLRAAKPVTSFRTAYAYDNVLYIAAGLAIEAVTGQSWSDVLRQRILTPLGMTETSTDIARMTSANAATPHGWVGGKLAVVPIDTIDATLAAGGIISNVTDEAKWVQVQLDSGRTPGGARLWDSRWTRQMWAPQTILRIGNPPPGPFRTLRPNFAAYGLGWSLRDYRGRKLVTHDGGLAGMISRTMLVPDERLGFVILTNAETNLHEALCWILLDHFLGATASDWITLVHDRETRARVEADSIEAAAVAARDTASRPSLPLARYAGRYTDVLYGDATIALEDGRLVLRFSRSPAFAGDLEHWQYDTFKTHWRTANIAEAFVTFALKPSGAVEQFKMAAVSPLADFSFDYQDLLFQPVEPAR